MKAFLGFHDECNELYDGTFDRGPKPACWFVIVLITIGLIDQAYLLLKKYQGKRVSVPYFILIIQVIHLLFSIIFMYKLCNYCHPWTGFFIVISMSVIVHLVLNKIHNLLDHRLVIVKPK